jgi:hypothetical protein
MENGKWNSGAAFKGPGDGLVAVIGEVGDVAGAGSGNARFDRRVGFLAAAHAVEEIGHVIDGAVAEGFSFEDGIVLAEDTFAVDAKAKAIEFERSLGAAKF